ncbi:MAG TPA: mechanosensitive ion channel family protein [Thermoanaerobaculia bacterium]|jgi:small-conductance mechanosensitive channel|nr:mechanosensitive ion channel family protein [Thermoanaerobaculia bacterium]
MSRACRTALLLIGIAAPAIAQTRTAAAPPALPASPQLLDFLNQTVSWYGRMDAEGQLADQPTDVLYVNDDRQLAAQVVARSFEFAKAYAQLLAAQEVSAAPSAPAAPGERYQRLAKNAATAADRMRRDQASLDALRRRLPAASGHDRDVLAAQIAEAESRLTLAQTRNETLSGMLAFLNNSGTASTTNDLGAQIAALEQTVPAVSTSNAAAVAAAAHKAPPAGIVGLITDLFSLNQKDYALQRSIRTADALSKAGRAFTTPMVAVLRQLTQRGDDMAAMPESNDVAVIGQRKAELDALAVRMRQLSAAMLPLTKRRILLDTYKANLTRWRASVIDQYRGELRRVIFRAVTLAVVLMLVFAFSALWRRVTFRYVQDVRRRHQFLLLRRIVTLVIVAGVIAASFATDVGSLTTFAGFLTAGIAIALQDVILSVAGYFVIIGKYGIRVGDRVQIAHVSGEVLEVGLVWMYLMEFEARGRDQLPTGRIVEFPNAVVFDHSAGIFKQLPGTRYLWHEVSVTVPATVDYRAVQERMLAAVNSVFADYGEAVQQQHREMERMLRLTMPPPHPQSRRRVAANGVEVTIRYPVELERAQEIDDRITAAVTEASGTATETQ